MSPSDLKALLKRAVELAMPNLRAYYRVVKKARVVRAYAADGRYWADVQPLRNDESVDTDEPVVAKVEIPVIWGGPGRGIVCPPAAGTLCDLAYYDGDPNYPRISSFRWKGNGAPACALGAMVMNNGAGTLITIGAGGNILLNAGGSTIAVALGGDITLTTTGTIILDADVQMTKTLTVAGAITGDGATISGGDIDCDGNFDAGGSITCGGSNPNQHTH